jgi:hypothetical protein
MDDRDVKRRGPSLQSDGCKKPGASASHYDDFPDFQLHASTKVQFHRRQSNWFSVKVREGAEFGRERNFNRLQGRADHYSPIADHQSR